MDQNAGRRKELRGNVFLWMHMTEAGVERTILFQGHENNLKMISSRSRSAYNNKREKCSLL